MTEKEIQKNLSRLFKKYFFEKAKSIKRIKGGVSERNVYKIVSENYVCIGVHNHKLKENKAFIEFSKSLKSIRINVPEIYCVSDNGDYYLEEFLGDYSIYDLVKSKKITDKEKLNLYKKALSDLAKIQFWGNKVIQYKYCYETKVFNRKQIIFDFNKFYDFYLQKLTKIKLSRKGVNNFKMTLVREILKEKKLFFMYRDFQPRNIMVKDNGLSYIDYQSGRKGPLQYDVASFLYSGSIDLDKGERKKLLNYYIGEISKNIKIDKEKFISSFYYFTFIRLLQVLGSYGYLYNKSRDKNLFEKIDKALKNVADIKQHINNEKLKYFVDKISPV